MAQGNAEALKNVPPKPPIKALGLEGIVALDSTLSFIDGAKGELLYSGYEIDDLARNTSFEEVAFLRINIPFPIGLDNRVQARHGI